MFQTLRERLTAACSDAFERLGHARRFGEVIGCDRPDMGDFQCNGAMGAAKAAGRKPRDLAAEVAAIVAAQSPDVLTCEVAGPGFINIRVTDAALVEGLSHPTGIPVADDAGEGTVFVDYGGPNIATIQNEAREDVSVRVPNVWVPMVRMALTEAVQPPMGGCTASRRR